MTDQKGILCVMTAYKTEPTNNALSIITGVTPIHLLADRRVYLYNKRDVTHNSKKEKRREIFRKWCMEWDRDVETWQQID